MRSSKQTRKNGFTLLEALTALTIMVGAVALAMGGYMFMQKNRNQQLAQDQIDSETHLATARLQREMLLSSLPDMAFHPPAAKKYTAISFPLIRNENIAKDADDKIIWDSTVIYHAYGSGSGMKLLRTEFSPRDNTLSATERQNQINLVVQNGNGNGAGTPNGENATTSCLFEQVFSWEIVPQGGYYDAYSAEPELDASANLGSFILAPGTHTMKLTATGKDSRSSGYRIAIDTLRISNSGLEREAENQQASGSPSPYVEENTGGLWSGGHQLSFDAQNVGNSLALTFYNDRWEDTNFDLFGNEKSNTVVGTIDTSYTPSEFTLKLQGNTTNWSAKTQTDDAFRADPAEPGGEPWTDSLFSGAIVRVLLRGQDLENPVVHADPFDHDSLGCRIAFKCSDVAANGNDLKILHAFIDTCAQVGSATPPYSLTPNTIGEAQRILFGGNNGILLRNGETAWSDTIGFPISADRSYAVTFWIENAGGEQIYPRVWKDPNGNDNSYVIAKDQPQSLDILTQATWDGGGISYTGIPYVVAVEHLYATYPPKGTYTSPPMDTLMDGAQFENIDWIEDCPSGTQLGIKVRSGNSSNMSDAPDWNNISTIPSPGSLNSIAYKRYVQYQATLESSGKGEATPKLRNIAIQWPGETRAVNMGGTFVNGPNHGQFETSIDDQPLSSPLRFSIELLKPVRGFNNTTETMISKSVFELYPRNNGR